MPKFTVNLINKASSKKDIEIDIVLICNREI